MSSAIPVQSAPRGRNRWIAAAVVLGAAVAAAAIALSALRPRPRPAAQPAAAPTTHGLPPGQAGPVGDLAISAEAMQLAEVRIAPAVRRTVAERLAASGVVQAASNRIARVTPRVAGKVVQVLVIEGDQVRAGQPLARIESSELARAQADYRQAVARVAAAALAQERQRRLARLGAFSRPRVEEARRSSVVAHGEVRTAESEAAAAAAEVSEAESALQTARSGLAQAQAQTRVARSRLERARLLLREELISRQEWEQTQADCERAAADEEAARARIAQAEAQLRSAQANLEAARARQEAAARRGAIEAEALSREEAVYRGGYVTNKEVLEAEAALRQARLDQQAAAQTVRLLGGIPGGGSIVALISPISGHVLERSVTLGQTVDIEHPLFTVVDLGEVWAQLALPPRDLGRVRVGQPAELAADCAPGRVFRGRVTAISGAADEATRTVAVRVSLPNPGAVLRPGTFVRGSIVTDVRRQQVVVPEGAIQEHTGRKTLYVAMGRPGSFEVRHVTLGASEGGWREVTAGLKGTERLAVSGTFYLKSEALKSQLSDGCCAVEAGEE